MSYPLVSVIIPSYNHEKFIVEALSSVVNQSYRNIEIIFLDDGSSDRTFELGSNYLSGTSRSISTKHSNIGAAGTINKGIAISSGKYINILNSDDYFDLDRIRLCVQAAESQSLDFIFSEVEFVDETSAIAGDDEYVSFLRNIQILDKSEYFTNGFAFLKNQISISTGNMFLSRRLTNLIGPLNDYLYVHDWDYALRALYYTEPFFLRKRLYNYRIHGSNSYKSLARIEGYETFEVMSNALWRLTSSIPVNGRAPSPYCWPGLFETFVKRWNYQTYLPPSYSKIKI